MGKLKKLYLQFSVEIFTVDNIFFFTRLFERALKVTKNGIHFTVTAVSAAESFKVPAHAN